MNQVEAAWLAGLIEGEGTIGQYKYGTRTSTVLRVEMKDKDVIEKAMKVAGCGNIVFKKARGNSKETWCWSITQAKQVEKICKEILPFMGARRSAKIREIFPM